MTGGAFFWGSKGEALTTEEIQRRRQLADALMQQGMDYSPVQHWSQGAARVAQALTGAYQNRRADAAQKENTAFNAQLVADAIGQPAQFSQPASPATTAPQPAVMPSTTFASNPSGVSAPTGGIASTDLPIEAQALLNTIAGPESAGRYDVMYGGGRIGDLSQHPRQAIPIASGPNAGKTSSAAGRYQFLGSTWDQYANKLGLSDFSPASQDKAAWALAQDVYRQKTGGDLTSALQSGDQSALDRIGRSLSGTWTSLPGGIEQGINGSRFASAYQNALGQNGSAPQVTQASSPAPTQSSGGMTSALLRALSDPRANPQTRAVAQALIQQQTVQQQAAREQQQWMQRQQYEETQRAADPLRQQQLAMGQIELERARNPVTQPVEVAGRLVNPQTGQVVADFSEPNTATVGDAVVDLRTGQPIYQGAPRPPSGLQEYDAYAADERAAGRAPLGRLQYEQALRSSGAARTNINTADSGEGALRKRLSEKEGEAWSALQTAGTTSAGSIQDLDLLGELIQTAPQGPLKGRAAQLLPGFSSSASAFDSVVKRVAPTLRATGSGSTSDIEYDGMLRSLPSLVNKPKANEAIVAMMREKAALNVQRSNIVDAYQNGDMDAATARRQIGELNQKSILTPQILDALGGSGAVEPQQSQPSTSQDGWQELSPGIRVRRVQ